MFCPFIKDVCNPSCVFQCRTYATSNSMKNSTTTCLIVKKLDSLNEMQSDQLTEIVQAIEALD